MKLQQLVDALLERTPLKVAIAEIEVSKPNQLSDPNLHHIIADATIAACLQSGFSVRGAYAFGEWFAELVTGWATRFCNEADILELERAFSIAAFGNSQTTIRCYFAPSWSALFEHLPQAQVGILATFEHAKGLN
ncbi:MAG: hypothetical protein N3B10_06365 [Armatimonadetes bacterium]|nr:hypothetical protein [Armatimonadota bacterium]